MNASLSACFSDCPSANRRRISRLRMRVTPEPCRLQIPLMRRTYSRFGVEPSGRLAGRAASNVPGVAVGVAAAAGPSVPLPPQPATRTARRNRTGSREVTARLFQSRTTSVADMRHASAFSPAERAYLAGGRQLGRLATVGADGTPHVVPVAFIYNAVRDTIDVGGRDLERTKKFRDIARSGRAAIVVDDLESTDPWRPRGIEVRGRGEAIAMPAPLIRIHPDRVVSWGV